MNPTQQILLFGMPRSGTTWIGKLFDSHPQVLYLHEPDSVAPDRELPLLVDQSALPQWQPHIEQQLAHWMAARAEKVIASRPFFRKSYMSALQWQLFRLSAYASKALSRFGLPLCRQPIRHHRKDADPVVVWKSIESIGRIGAYSQAADALAIQLMRHPCGNIASTLQGEKNHRFDGQTATADDWQLYEKLLEQAGEERFDLRDIQAMSPEERLTVRWGIMNDFALAQLAKLPGSQSRIIKYEDVCRSPLESINQLFEWAGLSFSESTLAFIKASTAHHSDDYYGTRKDPLTAAYRWQDKLSKHQIVRIQAMMNHFRCGHFYREDF